MQAQRPAAGERVAIAMSGGVDSAVAAQCLMQAGCHPMGVTMRLWRQGQACNDNSADLADAEAVCRHLGIPHRVVDLREPFRRLVVAPFVAAYAAGRTPNPCPGCNARVKFGLLRQAAHGMGCAWFATGHYARIFRSAMGPELFRGRDLAKDQSYVLYQLLGGGLQRAVFPLGNLLKSQVEAIAATLGLPTHHRAESQDLCFLPDGSYGDFVQRWAPEAVRPGPIRGIGGETLGTHRGLAYYTVGQRRGLGIAAPEPYYVDRLDAASNTIYVAHAARLGSRTLEASALCYAHGRPPAAGSWVRAKIRYRSAAVAATVWPLRRARARIVFAHPLRDITPGQAVVLYQGERVVGGGTIQRALTDEEA